MGPAGWVVLAGGLMVAEPLTVLFVAGYAAAGALAAALAAALGAPPVAQLAVFVAGTLLPLLATRRMLVRAVGGRASPRAPGRGLVGRTGTVTSELRPGEPGLVRVGGEVWSGLPYLDVVIPAGTRVEVVDAEGVVAHVHPLDEGTA